METYLFNILTILKFSFLISNKNTLQ